MIDWEKHDGATGTDYDDQDYYYSNGDSDTTRHRFHVFQQALRQGLLPWTVERAGDAPKAKLYYTALSVGVLTLGLLLFVEAMRRQLDHWAIQRPIFQAVLDGVYRELATLGIVELLIHLLHEYYDDLDTQKEEVFVDVHFVLFYTAIFNALQSSILAVFAHRVSYHTWVQTEELELNHYVEIREEFDHVRNEIYGTHDRQQPQSHLVVDGVDEQNGGGETRRSLVGSIKNISDSLQRSTVEFYDSKGMSCWNSLKDLLWGIFYHIKYPRLKAKHDRLLVQVRFHELRVHFLQAYELPLKLKVSTYLMRSEQAVLKHLIHVSTSLWLWLTGVISILYFLTGLVVEVTEDSTSQETTLAFFFIISMILFIVVSLLVFRRMRRIFMQIMEMKHLWDLYDDNNNNNASVRDNNTNNNNHHTQPSIRESHRRFQNTSLASEQLALFFLGDPKLVIVAIQFMQFGYAIALAIVVVYWEDMNSEGGHFRAEVYLGLTLICYVVFLTVTSLILPKYTMCTSLGQLVDRKRLQETVALFRLEEAERRRKQRMDMNFALYTTPNNTARPTPIQGLRRPNSLQQPTEYNTATTTTIQQQQRQQEQEQEDALNNTFDLPLGETMTAGTPLSTVVEGVACHKEPDINLTGGPPPTILSMPEDESKTATTVPSLIPPPVPFGKKPVPPKSLAPSMSPIPEKLATIEPDKASLLVDLVKMDTKALREAVPRREAVPLEDIRKAERRDRRRNRRKSVSDGVALMSAMGNLGQLGQNIFGTAANEATGANKEATTLAEATNKGPLPKVADEKEPPKFAVDDSVLLKRKERRRNRKKAVSASSAIQQMRDFKEDGENKEKIDARAMLDGWKAKPAAKPPAEINLGPKPSLPSTAQTTKPFASADDSTATMVAMKERRERRRNRKKSLSASAAVRLMRQIGDDDEERALEHQSMLEFWGGQPRNDSVAEGEVDAQEYHDTFSNEARPSYRSLQQSERLLQNTSFLAALYDGGDPTENDKNMLMPVREVPSHMEDSSSHFDPLVLTSDSREHEPDSLALLPSTDELVANGSQEKDFSGSFHEDGDDDETVATDRSVGGLSHVSDASDINYYRHTSFLADDEEQTPSFSARVAKINDKMQLFVMSKAHTLVTHILGTVVCFFLLGMRVEGFLKQQCLIPINDFTWEFNLNVSFWLIVVWIGAFLLGSGWFLMVFRPSSIGRPNEQGNSVVTKQEKWILFLAAIFDIVISLTCLLLLFGAEVERCCNGNEYSTSGGSCGQLKDYASDDHTAGNHTDYDSLNDHYGTEPTNEDLYRFLAEAYDSYGEVEECKDDTICCNCPTFGSRVEGGLGNIEPFVALIALRIFRFLVARIIVQRFDLGTDLDDDRKQGISTDHGMGKKSHGGLSTAHGGHGTDSLQNGTAVELWQAAVGQFPEIVEKYGEFSGELLQAMLGVEVTEPHTQVTAFQESTDKASSPKGSESAFGGSLRRSLPSSDNPVGNDHVTLDNKKYCSLAPEVQEIIVAGKLGMPVKSCQQTGTSLSRDPSCHDLVGLAEIDGATQLEFQVDIAQMELDKFESTSMFEFPNARLLRSMRRCERKLLPLLDKWSPVDVVFTKHEIVYVHVSDSDGSENDQQLREAGRLALKATKGGKGLRLCDVIAGRHVIGQLSFADILAVHVERKLPLPGHAMRSADEATAELSHGRVEFWQDSLEDDRAESPVDIQKRWESVHEDALKVTTIHGTLLLRFFSDLEDSEAHPERLVSEMDGSSLYKDIALQWAQTIVRHCDISKLQQPLPHLGANDEEELRDLLLVIHREEKHTHRRFASGANWGLYSSKGHRRLRSAAGTTRPISELPELGSVDIDHGDASGDHPLKKPGVLSEVPPVPRPRKITRFASDVEDGQQTTSADDENRAQSIG